MNNHIRAVEFEEQFRAIFGFADRPIEKPFDVDGIESGKLYQCIFNAFNKLNVSEDEVANFKEKYQNAENCPLRQILNIEQLQHDFEEIVSRYTSN